MALRRMRVTKRALGESYSAAALGIGSVVVAVSSTTSGVVFLGAETVLLVSGLGTLTVAGGLVGVVRELRNSNQQLLLGNQVLHRVLRHNLRNDIPTGVRRPVAFICVRSVHRRMTEILAENLSGKAVMGSDGADLGMLYNITMDLDSGRLQDLLVEPSEEGSVQTEFETDSAGRLRIPVGRVQAVKDHMIIER